MGPSCPCCRRPPPRVAPCPTRLRRRRQGLRQAPRRADAARHRVAADADDTDDGCRGRGWTGRRCTSAPQGADVLRCPCGGRRTVRRLHSTRAAAEARLRELGVSLPSRLLPPPTAPPQLVLDAERHNPPSSPAGPTCASTDRLGCDRVLAVERVVRAQAQTTESTEPPCGGDRFPAAPLIR